MNRKNRIDRRGLLTEEGGWTLIELLVGMAIMLAIVFAALPIVEGATNTEGRIQTSATSIGEARTFSDQVLQDLRAASQVKFDSGSREIVTTWVRHSTCGDPTPIPRARPRFSATSPTTAWGLLPMSFAPARRRGGPS